jgi:hypothetical protein
MRDIVIFLLLIMGCDTTELDKKLETANDRRRKDYETICAQCISRGGIPIKSGWLDYHMADCKFPCEK